MRSAGPPGPRNCAETTARVIGAAIHSVRAVPAEQLPVVVEAAAGRPLHVHVSEQIQENTDCIAAYGATPTQLLADHGVLGPMTTAVHATHLTSDDIHHLGSTGTHACFCPTTERDLGDGVGPSRLLHDAGSPLTTGSDSHAVIDPFEEMRAVEMDERLADQSRGHWSAAELLAAATTNGHASLGFPDAGAIEVGARADLVTLDTATPRTAGTGADEQTAVFAATAADVVQVIVDGRLVYSAGRRRGDRPRARRSDRRGVADVSTLITNIGELVTNDPEADEPLGIVERAAIVIDGTQVAWVGRADRGAGRRPAGRRRGPGRDPRLRRLPLPPRLRRRPRRGVRGPDGR